MRKRFSALAMVVIAMMLVVPAVIAANTPVQVDVTPGEMNGWVFVQEHHPSVTPSPQDASGDLVNGPDSPPIGSGSANLLIDSSNVGIALSLYGVYNGVALSDLSTLKYFAYHASGGVQAVSLQLNVDYDGTDATATWQGRLVFEPYENGVPVSGQWDEWDAISGGNARWWMSGNAVVDDAAAGRPCPQSSPCTWDVIRGFFPRAVIRTVDGGIHLKAGSGPGWSGFDGNADALTIGVNGIETIYNFEASPTDRSQCMNGGWAAFSDPLFKNQGDCVSHVRIPARGK